MTTVPKIAAVKAMPGHFTLAVTWDNGTTDHVNVGPLIARYAIYAALDNETVFSQVRVGEWRHHIEWPGKVDMPAHTLWRLAREQAGDTIPVDEIKAIRARLGLSQAQLASRLGLSKRMIVNYEQGTHIVPKATALALLALDAGLAIRVA